MSEKEAIIIKRIKKAHKGHHGGAWKVAYADFVTAMMALFIVLWMIAMLSKDTRKGVAEYFRSFSLVKGESMGGTNMSTLPGDVLRLQPEPGGVKRAEAKEGREWSTELQENIKKTLEVKMAAAMDQVYLIPIAGGVRIEIVERLGKAMFSLGEARLLENGEKILELIAGELRGVPHPLWIEGHTDAYPYPADSYTNWELSVDRANAVRRKLVDFGIKADRITKVIGYADTDPIVKDDPYSPLNRRVSIVVKEKRKEGVRS
jgi:chemotaxis protein MotB